MHERSFLESWLCSFVESRLCSLVEAWLCSLVKASEAAWVLVMSEIKKLIITGDKNVYFCYISITSASLLVSISAEFSRFSS